MVLLHQDLGLRDIYVSQGSAEEFVLAMMLRSGRILSLPSRNRLLSRIIALFSCTLRSWTVPFLKETLSYSSMIV